MAYKKNYQRKTRAQIDEEIQLFSDKALTNIKAFTNKPEDILELSDFMSNFYHYSSNNMAMIHSQFKGAYAVGSFKSFSDAGFKIDKGSKGIKILVPVEVTLFEDQEGATKSISSATAAEKAKIKSGVIETKKVRRYKLGNVFDISQTNAKPEDLPKIFPNRHYNFDLPSNSKHLFAALESIGDKINVPFGIDHDRSLGNAKGAYAKLSNGSEVILMNPKNLPAENISVGIHELTHAKLHDFNDKRKQALSPSAKEFQAELTSHIVSKHFGIDTTEAAIPYIATWTKNGESLDQKAELLREVHDAARNLISEIHHELEIQQDIETERKISAETTIPVKEKESHVQSEPAAKKSSSKKRISEADVVRATEVDLLDFANSQGYQFKKDSNRYYRNIDHDSLIIDRQKNMFNWNSQSKHGNTINFAREVLGIENFHDAVATILGEDIKKHDYIETVVEPYVYDPTKESKNFTKARNYLVNERRISSPIVDCLHKKGYIRQDKRGNVIFCWVDNKRIVGVSEQGTIHSDKFKRGSWKHIQERSGHDKAFNFTIGQPKNLKYFESSIDALSYVTLHPNIQDTKFIAMEGVKDAAFKYYLKDTINVLGTTPDSIKLCVDNDTGGRKFAGKESLFDFYKSLGGDRLAKIETEFPPIPENKIGIDKWDWNDQAKYMFEKKIASRNQSLEQGFEREQSM
ncbi:DUF3991 domain-containing protein [Enterococcus sp. AZ072]|uniref:DUF3991 domain-containing protein n=1 Tax=unclassified Enterococcus TaxID=2608891 RepID=UPI003D2B6931